MLGIRLKISHGSNLWPGIWTPRRARRSRTQCEGQLRVVHDYLEASLACRYKCSSLHWKHVQWTVMLFAIQCFLRVRGKDLRYLFCVHVTFIGMFYHRGRWKMQDYILVGNGRCI